MAGVLGIYGLITAVIIIGGVVVIDEEEEVILCDRAGELFNDL